MQHTEMYQLNLIEASDTFSPDALNANTRKVEAALDAVRAGAAADADALGGRVAALEARRIFMGTYQGTNNPLTIELGFTPGSVLLFRLSTSTSHVAIRLIVKGEEYLNSTTGLVDAKIVEGGFYVRSGVYNSTTPYAFIAIT